MASRVFHRYPATVHERTQGLIAGFAYSPVMTGIDPVLLRKYQQTEYCVYDRGSSFVLDLGRPSNELADLYRERRVATAAFITAYNPCSQPSNDAENAAANTRLRQALKALGAEVMEAVGSDPAGHWSEPSLLALGLSRAQAESLGKAYRQNAIVFAGADAVPELLLLR